MTWNLDCMFFGASDRDDSMRSSGHSNVKQIVGMLDFYLDRCFAFYGVGWKSETGAGLC